MIKPNADTVNRIYEWFDNEYHNGYKQAYCLTGRVKTVIDYKDTTTIYLEIYQVRPNALFGIGYIAYYWRRWVDIKWFTTRRPDTVEVVSKTYDEMIETVYIHGDNSRNV